MHSTRTKLPVSKLVHIQRVQSRWEIQIFHLTKGIVLNTGQNYIVILRGIKMTKKGHFGNSELILEVKN